MKYIPAIVALITAAACAAHGESLSITGPNRYALLQGQDYQITWSATDLKSVSLFAYGARTPLGGKPRGNFRIEITTPVPADQGAVQWTVPWIDAVNFTVKAKGYDSGGSMVTAVERRYGFRPAAMAKRSADGIYLDLHQKIDQRLYVQEDGRITRAYLSSSSEGYDWLPRNKHPMRPHDHAGVFKVLDKSPRHESKLFNVPMRWAMRYYGGHFIHATSANLYKYLGTSASHGCNRLTRRDAYQLYQSTPVGTRVEIIGPEG